MACWSAENATNAYLKAMRMGKGAKEPNGSEFISALAAGNNAQFIVVACSGAADSTTLALVAAAQQTGGRIVCILPGLEELRCSQLSLGTNADHVEFVIGDSESLLSYRESDFIAIDCNLDNHETILSALQLERPKQQRSRRDAIVIGYNALNSKDSWRKFPWQAQLLPIGQGLLLTRTAAASATGRKNKSNWIVKVDKCTGEEHVFRVRSSVGKFIKA